MMSYCLRPAEDNNTSITSNSQHTTNQNITFIQLKQMNITSRMLLLWSAPIDVTEQYQIFLDHGSIASADNDIVFHNCTPPWFGPFCRFTFDYPFTGSFRSIADRVYHDAVRTLAGPQVTCYSHLACRTKLSCLDWREICDGKEDCFDGADEKNCWQLEMNECADNEYRCANGHCIPWEYYHNDYFEPDCSDKTDERPKSIHVCPRIGFECEEHTCRPGKKEFPCGDGECVDETSTCPNGRHSFLPRNFCTNATRCAVAFYDYRHHEWCKRFCPENNCMKDNCSMAYEFRALPLLFGHVRFMVSNETIDSDQFFLPDYICYDTKLCPHFPLPTASFDHLTCRHFNDFGLRYTNYGELTRLVPVIKNLFRGCLITADETHHCNSSSMYQCINSSKCISKHRLLDGFGDCPFGDDEIYNQSCSLPDIRQRFKCRDQDNDKCLSFLAIENGMKECKYGEDEYTATEALVKTHISLAKICDKVTHLSPLLIDGQNETDETGCEPWECNNTYTRCDGIWSCKNGADEVDCLFSTCPIHHHICVFPNDTSNVSCLPIDRAGDDIVDCVGGTDEQTKYYMISGDVNTDSFWPQFRCWNNIKLISSFDLCNDVTDCPLNDDEAFCKSSATFPYTSCSLLRYFGTDVAKFICNSMHAIPRSTYTDFKLHNLPSHPLQLVTNNAPSVPLAPTQSLTIAEDLNDSPSFVPDSTCHRRVALRSLMHGNSSKVLCLCPPTHYGDRCQYQNQRVSLTFQIRPTSDWRSIFVFFITLIDTQTNIESHEYIQHIPTRDCSKRYDIYLLYATRPKDASKTFSVRISAFVGMTLTYRASWIFPLRFSFLPVHRPSVLLRLPFSTTVLAPEKCSPPCVHGQCSLYVNDQHSTFCHCESGWSGTQCDTKLKCNCASDAICISDSICLCPPGRFGPRCRLSHFICHSQSCLNGGQCVPLAEHYVFGTTNPVMCICPEGYIGSHCEHRQQQQQTQIDISFHRKLTIPPSVLIHLVAVQAGYEFKLPRTSTAKKLQFDQSLLTLYTTTSFNIGLIQMFDDYYLIVLRKETIIASHISTEVIPDHRCRSLTELFNDTLTSLHLLKRIKFYHFLCKQHRQMACFYDEVHMCLCTLDRTANCWEFDHDMTYECEKAKYCGNDGQCFQDDPKCPTSSFCTCHRCYFGSRCQFSTKGSTLSLDIILGYHIRSENTIVQQPSIVKTAIALTSIILAFGMINGFLSFQTFRGKETRSVGCGLYILTTSILSMTTVIVLTHKFAFLLASQVGSIDNRWFLKIQCASMDVLLRSLISTNDWLSACVAIERVVSAIQGVKFDKAKSRRVARWMIVMVVVVTSCSYIYDPVHRRVMDDEEEQRTWCLTRYSSTVQVFDWIVNIFHISLPFVINAISAAIIIMTVARTRSNLQKKKSFKQHLREQLHHHKHLIISPLAFIVLAAPRLVISFLSGCMGSARESWLYLIGYYISFIPTTITVLIFILPSELYSKELYKQIKKSWRL